MAKKKKQQYVLMCPYCGSTDVHVDFSNPVVWNYGANTKYVCNSCGFVSNLFPEVEIKKIIEYQKGLKTKLESKEKLPDKDIVDIKAGFTIGIFEIFLAIISIVFMVIILIISR